MENTTPQNGNTSVAVFDTNEKAIALLNEKYSRLVISDSKTFESVKSARTEMVSIRTGIQKSLKEAYKPYDTAKTELKNEAARLTGLAAPTETYLQSTVKAWEDKKLIEKQERDRIEQERTDSIKAKIEGIRAVSDNLQGKSAEFIKSLGDTVNAVKVDESIFQEFIDEAAYVKDKTIRALRQAYSQAKQREDEDAQRIADRAELDRQKEEMAEKQRKMDEQQAALDRQQAQTPTATEETIAPVVESTPAAIEKNATPETIDHQSDGFDDDLVFESPAVESPMSQMVLTDYQQGFIDGMKAGTGGHTLDEAIQLFLAQSVAA